MAEGDITIYNAAKKEFGDGDIDWLVDTIKVALVTGYTPNIDTHVDYADISASEVSGTGYTVGGETLTGKTSTVNVTTDLAEFDAANVVWTGLDVGTPSHAIVYKDTGAAPTSLLICYVEITTASNGSNYTIQWGANGVFTIS